MDTQAQAKQLTSALRDSDDSFWTRLRELLHERGIDPQRAVLAESFPDDACQEFGIVITPDEHVFRFVVEWPEGEDESKGTFVEWTDLTDGWKHAPQRGLIMAGVMLVRREVQDAERDERHRRVEGHEEFVSRVSALLCAADPDEYKAEAQCIVAELLAGVSQAEFLSLVHKTLIEWFSPDIAGPESQYAAVSEQIWDAWSSYRPAGN